MQCYCYLLGCHLSQREGFRIPGGIVTDDRNKFVSCLASLNWTDYIYTNPLKGGADDCEADTGAFLCQLKTV